MKWTNLLIAACAVLLFVLLFPSKSSAFDWGSYRLNSDNNAVAFDTKHFNNEAVAKPITLDLGNPANVVRPVVGGSVMFIATGSSTSSLRAVNIATGQTLWIKEYSTQITKTFYSDNYLYISSTFFAKIDPKTGEEVFRVSKDSSNRNLPTSEILQISGNKIFAVKSAASPQFLIILDKNDGHIIHEGAKSLGEYVPNILVSDSGFYLVKQSWSNPATRIEAYDNSYQSLWFSSYCNIKSGTVSLDLANNSIHLISTNGNDCGYDVTTGGINYSNKNISAKYLVKYGDVQYGVYDYYITNFDAKDKTATISSELVLKYSDEDGKFSSSPIIFNGVLYAGTDTGKIYGRNLETGTENKWVIGNGAIDNIFYADGKFIIQETSSSSKNIYIYDVDGLNLQPNNFTIKLNSPYKVGSFNQYLGQTHCHYIPDVNWMKLYRNDIPIIPADTVLKYKDAGYDFVALTEHNKIVPMPVVEGILQIQNAEEDTQGTGGNHILALGIQNPIDETKSSNERIEQVTGQGGIAVLAHPNSTDYPWRLESILSNTFLEINNFAMRKLNGFQIWGNSFSINLWDSALSRRMPIFGTGGDDYTPGDFSFDGSAIVVLSQSILQNDIISNIRDGNFYAVQGSTAPRMNITTGEGSISVSTNTESEIRFVGNQGKVLQRVEDASSASYTVDGTEVYVRIEVEADSKTSWSQPIFVDKISAQSTSTSGEHIASLGKANIKSNSSSILKGEVLSQTGLPPIPPEMGYVGPAYAVTPAANIPGSSISMDYSQDKNGVDPDNLDACGYNSETRKWELLNAEHDIAWQTITAQLSSYEAYTICQKPVNDETGPSISLISPLELNNISGIVDFAFEVNDPTGVSTVRFALDGVEYSLRLQNDGYYHAIINFNNLPAGNHTMNVLAEDNFGNITEKTFEINSSSNYIIPEISLDSPTESKHYAGNLSILGNVKNYGEQSLVSIFIDNMYIKDLYLIGGKFSDDLDIANFADGQHEFEVRFIDQFGNEIKKKVNIFFGLENEPSENTPTNLDDNHEETAETSDRGTADVESMSGPIAQPKETDSKKSLPETVSSLLLTEKIVADDNTNRLKVDNGKVLGSNVGLKKFYTDDFLKSKFKALWIILIAIILMVIFWLIKNKVSVHPNKEQK